MQAFWDSWSIPAMRLSWLVTPLSPSITSSPASARRIASSERMALKISTEVSGRER